MSVRKLSSLYENINNKNNSTISTKPSVETVFENKSLTDAVNLPSATKNNTSTTNEGTTNISKHRNIFERTNSVKMSKEFTTKSSNSSTLSRSLNSNTLIASSKIVKDQNFKSLLGQKLQNPYFTKLGKDNSNIIEDNTNQQINTNDLHYNEYLPKLPPRTPQNFTTDSEQSLRYQNVDQIKDLKQNFAQQLNIEEELENTDSCTYDYIETFNVLSPQKNFSSQTHDTNNDYLETEGSTRYTNIDQTLPTSSTSPVPSMGQQNSSLANHQTNLPPFPIKNGTNNDYLVVQRSTGYQNIEHLFPTSSTTPVPPSGQQNSSLANQQTNLPPFPIKNGTNNDDLVVQRSTGYQNIEHLFPTSSTTPVPPSGQQNSPLANHQTNLPTFPIKNRTNNDYLVVQGSTGYQNIEHMFPTSRTTPVPSSGQQNSPLAIHQTNLPPFPIKNGTNNDYLVAQRSTGYQNIEHMFPTSSTTPVPPVGQQNSPLVNHQTNLPPFPIKNGTNNDYLVAHRSTRNKTIEKILPTSSKTPVPPVGQQNSPLANHQTNLPPFPIKNGTNNDYLVAQRSTRNKTIENILPTSSTTPVPRSEQQNFLLATKTMLPIDGSTKYMSPNTSKSSSTQNIMSSSQTVTPVVPQLKNAQSIIDKELSTHLFQNINAQKGFSNELRNQAQNEQIEYSNCIDIEKKISDIIYGRVGLKFRSFGDDQFFGDTVRQSFLSLQSDESFDDFDSDDDWDNSPETNDHQPTFTTSVQHDSIQLQHILNNPQTQNLKWSQIMNEYQIDISQIRPHEKNLQDAKFALAVSEWSFLKSINVLYEQFVQKLFIVLSKNEASKLFAYVKEVKKCSENLLNDIEKCWSSNRFTDNFCETILQNLEKNFEVYVQYCANQVYSEVLLGEIVSDKTRTFKEFLDDIQCDPVCNGLHLHAYQLIPIRKINSFPILLENILQCLPPQNKEYQHCKKAMNFLNQLLHRCNELVKQAKNHLKTKSLLEKLDFPKNAPLKINEIGEIYMRQFIKSDQMELIKINKTLLGKKVMKKVVYVFLFNDIFAIAQKNGTKYTVIDYCFRINLELIPDNFFISVTHNIDTNKLLFIYIKENKDLQPTEIILSCETKTDAIRWTEALDPPDTAKTDKTFTFDYIRKVIVQRNYSAIHSDEISLTIGETFTILQDSEDGWSFGQREKDGECGWLRNENVLIIDDVKDRVTKIKQKYHN